MIRLVKATLFSTSLLLLSSASHAMSESEFNSAFQLFINAADKYDEQSIEKADDHLANISTSGVPSDLVLVFRGSLESMRANTVFLPWNKMTHVDAGVEMMEDALDNIDDAHEQTTLGGASIALRIKSVAAHTYFSFPKFLNRYQDAKDLLADILESPRLESASQDFRNSIYRLAADMAEEEGNIQQQQHYLGLIVD